MRYIFGFLVVLLLIFLGLFLLFGHHGGKSTTKTIKPMTLPDYASTNAAVSMTIDGVVNGNDVHRAIRITVDSDSRTIDTIQGYSGNVIDSHTYANTEDAYSVFLRALNNSGFTVRMKKTAAPNDPRGQCPAGTRITFDLAQNGKQLSDLWSSSCGTGTFGGNSDLIQALFQNQITDYSTITGNVQLD